MRNQHLSRMIETIIGIWVFVILLITFVATPLLNPPQKDISELTLLMGVSGSVSTLVAYLIYRSGLVNRLFSLRNALMLVTLFTIVLMLVNIWILTKEMFIEYHDLNLNAVLLLFAGWTSIGCAYFIACALNERITRLADGAERLASGDLSTRVEVTGNDEITGLAVAFNTMSSNLQEAARQKETLEQGRRDLIAWASHDLRTPLASLRLVVDAMADGVVDDEATRQRYLSTAQMEIANLDELISDLFELSQLDSGHLDLRRERTSLSDLLSDTLSAMRALAERRGVKLMGEVDDTIDPVEIDAEKIQRVLYNLLVNAIRHTSEGGEVHLCAKALGDRVQVTVTDSGEGIQQADLPYVFDRFYRGERARTRDHDGQRGAGLGLAIARGLIEAHNGTIEVQSAPGQGATFRFTLPRNA
ncbi:MAG: HAMP domain-containing protein [Anaerolineae bacterium]|nr:HAMP domain-containing protein [Anaerolineae bacterium]